MGDFSNLGVGPIAGKLSGEIFLPKNDEPKISSSQNKFSDLLENFVQHKISMRDVNSVSINHTYSSSRKNSEPGLFA